MDLNLARNRCGLYLILNSIFLLTLVFVSGIRETCALQDEKMETHSSEKKQEMKKGQAGQKGKKHQIQNEKGQKKKQKNKKNKKDKKLKTEQEVNNPQGAGLKKGKKKKNKHQKGKQ